MRTFKLITAIATLTAIVDGQLAPKQYTTLPLGQIRPAGWLSDQLNVQMTGLAGHLHEFYRYVAQTDWTGGNSYYSSLEEAGSYWFNAMVSSGVLSNNTAINQKTREFLDYVLSHQDTNGWLGPEVGTTKPRYLWGRYPFFFGAIQMTEADPSLTTRVVTALHKFVVIANTMLKNGQGIEPWTATRWEDFVMVLQWLHDYHPEGNEALLIDTMKRLKWTGVPWEKVFATANFPTKAVDNTPNPFPALTWHGVNMAEGLKALPSTYRFTQNQTDLQTASTGWDLLFRYHGRPSGIYAADEYLAGLDPHRGTELCIVVEAMFSGSYLYQVIGDTKFLDRVERMAYNALPGTLTGDMWSHQYLQQQNQISVGNMTPNPFPVAGPNANVFGLEPNYPCCTVNYPQGWPKFITNAFLVTPNMATLIQAFLGPFSVATKLGSGGTNSVTVNVDTQYPFSDVLTTKITATAAFQYAFRVPSWVVGGTIAVNGGAATALAPSNGLHRVSVGAGSTTLVVNLPAIVTTESRPRGSIAVHRGPLHYAFDIPRSSSIIKRDPQETRAIDLHFNATTAWQYAIDPSTLKFVNTPPSTGKLPSPIFDSDLPPYSITVTACRINWPLLGTTYPALPPQNPACTSTARTTLTLRPYGATKLRISEFPTFKA